MRSECNLFILLPLALKTLAVVALAHPVAKGHLITAGRHSDTK
jgi:hypothetical protein